jgi:hypothetical protein
MINAMPTSRLDITRGCRSHARMAANRSATCEACRSIDAAA